MSKTLDTFVTEIQEEVRDASGNIVSTTSVMNSLNRAIDILKSRYGIRCARNNTVLEVFDDIYEYPLPTGFDYPIILRQKENPLDFDWKMPDEFWKRLNSSTNVLSIDSKLGSNFLLASVSGPKASVNIVAASSLTEDGEWQADASSDALNLTIDSAITAGGSSSSFNFDLDVSQSANNYGAIYNDTIDAKDLSDYDDLGTFFVDFYIPDNDYISGLTLRWGSSSSNYWYKTSTTQHNGLALQDGWNRVSFDWRQATESGSPDASAIDYLWLSVNYSSSQGDDTDFRMGKIILGKPESYDLVYYSNYFVVSSAGAYQAHFSTGDDESLFADAEGDSMLYFYALADAHKLKEQFDEAGAAKADFEGAFSSYKVNHPSARRRMVKRYI